LFGLVVENVLTLLGYAPVTFPGITEAVEAGNFTLAEEWVKKTAAAIRVAGNIIKT
jgi:N-acetylated-alpha-linked acidic dipeptidase